MKSRERQFRRNGILQRGETHRIQITSAVASTQTNEPLAQRVSRRKMRKLVLDLEFSNALWAKWYLRQSGTFKRAWEEVRLRTQEGGYGSSITGLPAVLIVYTKGNVILFHPLTVIMVWSCIWSGAKVMLLKWGWESPAMVTERQIFCLLPLLRTPGQHTLALRPN